MSNEDYKVRRIPENFGNGINIAGFHFRVIFLVEGIILALIMLIISFIVMKSIGLKDIGSMLGVALVFVGVALFIGIKGINDEPITTFIGNIMFFNKHRRTAYYNPRIKLEAKSVMAEKIENENKDAIPREKILAFFSKYKTAMDKKQQEKAKAFEEANAFDKSQMYFEDDIGIIKRPSQYMTREESDEYDRKKRKSTKYRKENLR